MCHWMDGLLFDGQVVNWMINKRLWIDGWKKEQLSGFLDRWMKNEQIEY